MVLSWDDSEAAVAEIFEPVTKPPLIYMHNWTPGDLVVWCANYRVALAHSLVSSFAQESKPNSSTS